jgi:integrase
LEEDAVAIFKRGRTYWFHFWFEGQHVQRSTKQGNPRVARQVEAAYRTELAKGMIGIAKRKPVPTLKDFAQQFIDAIQVRCAAKPRTVEFYGQQLARLLDFERMANARLNDIDEALIESFVQYRRQAVSAATVNRALATLRRLLRLAHEWRIIDRVPRVRLLQGERSREFVLTHAQERIYLESAPQPLRDVALLILETGLRVGEVLTLTSRDVHLRPAKGARFGYLQVREGKSRNARRIVSLTPRASALLEARLEASDSEYAFASKGKPLTVSYLDHVQSKLRRRLQLPQAFVLHSLRHTFLTRLGLAGVDAFTIMRLAGHSSITVSQRYVHPTPEAMEQAVAKLEMLNRLALEAMPGAEKRQPPATESATLPEATLVSH